jgi:hypothetical protein
MGKATYSIHRREAKKNRSSGPTCRDVVVALIDGAGGEFAVQ